METRVQLMDEKQAFDFMDEHTVCIDTETYDRIFGEPDKGIIAVLHIVHTEMPSRQLQAAPASAWGA